MNPLSKVPQCCPPRWFLGGLSHGPPIFWGPIPAPPLCFWGTQSWPPPISSVTPPGRFGGLSLAPSTMGDPCASPRAPQITPLALPSPPNPSHSMPHPVPPKSHLRPLISSSAPSSWGVPGGRIWGFLIMNVTRPFQFHGTPRVPSSVLGAGFGVPFDVCTWWVGVPMPPTPPK